MRIDNNPFIQKVKDLQDQTQRMRPQGRKSERTASPADSAKISEFQSKFLGIEDRLKTAQSQYSLLQQIDSEAGSNNDWPLLKAFVEQSIEKMQLGDETKSDVKALLDAPDRPALQKTAGEQMQNLRNKVGELEVEMENLTAEMGTSQAATSGNLDTIYQMDRALKEAAPGQLKADSVLKLLSE